MYYNEDLRHWFQEQEYNQTDVKGKGILKACFGLLRNTDAQFVPSESLKILTYSQFNLQNCQKIRILDKRIHM
jgi:hypothetical protein